MTRCCQVTSHHLNQCWPSSVMPYDGTKTQWADIMTADGLVTKCSLGMTRHSINSLWPNDAIWRHRSGSTLVQVMACCLTAPSHYLNQCWPSDAIWRHRSRSTLVQVMACCLTAPSHYLNQCWPSDAIWRHRSGSTLVQVMACCLTAPSHYLNQCWPIISKVQLHSSDAFSKEIHQSSVTKINMKITQGVQPWALTKFPDFSLTFPWPFCGFPWPWDILSAFHYCRNTNFASNLTNHSPKVAITK